MARGQRRTNLAAVEARLAEGCLDCLERDLDVLQFDHVRGARRQGNYREGGNAEWRGMKAFAASHDWPEVEAELHNCDVVCANCHLRRTAARRRADKQLRELIRAAKGID